MPTRGLAEQVEGFLAADGFAVERPAAHCIAGVRQDTQGTAQKRFIWLVDPEHGIVPEPAALVEDFVAAKPRLVDGVLGYLLVPTMAGLDRSVRQAASDAGIGVRVPVQFFDTPYKAEGDRAFGAGRGREARSVAAAYLRQHGAAAALRVAQPFEALAVRGEAAGGFGAGPDLLARLVEDMAAPHDGPRLWVVLGNAGSGKSFLFAALFAELHARFLADKLGQRPGSRPILFTPEHIREAATRSLDGLLDAVAATDAASPTPPALMRFLNREGLTTWMFDGLDEFFAGETDFVETLASGLDPASRARFLICTRDSLVTSSSALKGLIDRHLDSGVVRLFELARWQRPSQRALAFARLEGRLPRADEVPDPPRVARFLSDLDSSPAATELATLPYYCDLMLALGDGAELPADESVLLSAAVDGLIDREAGKLATGELGFRWDVFSGAEGFVAFADLVENWGAGAFKSVESREGLLAALESLGRERLLEFVEGLAHHMRMTVPFPNDSTEISTEDIEGLANFYLDVGVDPALEPRVLLAVVQLAFFGPGDRQGHVRFAHEIVADYLAARHALRMLRTHPDSADALGQALGVRQDLERSIVLRLLVREIAADPELAAAVRAHVEAGHVRAAHVANAHLLVARLEEAGV